MKKLLAMLLALVMVLSFAACGTTEEPAEEPTDAPVEEPTEEPTEEPAEATYTLGLGTVVSQTVGEKAQVDATFAAVVLDAEGTIVAVDLDVAQSKGVKNDAGVYTKEGFDARTKTEKGPDYGMAVASPIGAEWDAQMAAFEAWAIGKTVADIEAMELTTNDHGYTVAADADLYAGCTMQVSSYIEATVKALGYAD
jgi:predicted small lipoprotein YifL